MRLRRLAPPHLVLAGFCAGLCVPLAWRPSMPALAAVVGVVFVGVVLGASVGVTGPTRALALADGLLGRRAVALAAPLALTSVFFMAGVSVGGARLDALARSDLASRVGRHVALRATLVDLPALDEDQLTLAVKVNQVDGVAVDEPAHLRLKLDGDETLPLDHCGPMTEGALLAVDGVRVEDLPPPPVDGGFDYGRYLRRRGEHVVLTAAYNDLCFAGRRAGLQGLVDRLRLASRAHLYAGLRGPVREVLQGMVLGDDEGVDQQVIDDFRASGLLHIMAVSGENVVLLCSMWSFVLLLLGVPRLPRTLVLLPMVATYVLLTGASPSIVRAGVAGIVGLFAVLASRPTDGWLLWLAPGAFLLAVNPANLFDVSFQLSFAAVAGLLLLSRPLARLLRFLPGPVAEQAGVTTAASLSTAPVSMLTFGSASLVAVPANLAGGFVLGPIMFFGMLSLLLGFVSNWASLPLNLIAGLFIGFLLEVAKFFGRLPFAVYEWEGARLWMTLALGAAAETALLWVLARRAGSGLRDYVVQPRRRALIAVLSAAVAAAALVGAPVAPAAPSVPTFTYLDVGEGAAALLRVPGGPTVLIDGGPDPLGLRLERLGVRRVDLLVVSHAHADHAAGLADVVARLPVRTALLPSLPEPSDGLRRLAADLAAAGVGVQACTTAITARGNGWSLTVMPTRPPPGEGGNQGENDAALVAVVSIGSHRLLVPGDAEGDVLAQLGLPPCDVVELPHHGSRGGLDNALLGTLHPSLAVISVGPNKFGHPTAEMLALLRGAGVPCLRTDRAGDITIRAAGQDLSVTASDP
jgi:competence protein ComEC